MPLYEYECASCEHRFEALTTLAAADEQRCPSCDEARVKRLISVIAGGTGFAEAPAPSCGGGACGNC